MRLEVEEITAGIPPGWEEIAVRWPDHDTDRTLRWALFIRPVDPADRELWLCIGGTDLELYPHGFNFRDAQMEGDYRKLVALFGMPFDDLADDFVFTTHWQQHCLKAMSGAMWRALDQATAEEIAEWREERQGLARGEVLLHQLTGEDPVRARN